MKKIGKRPPTAARPISPIHRPYYMETHFIHPDIEILDSLTRITPYLNNIDNCHTCLYLLGFGIKLTGYFHK